MGTGLNMPATFVPDGLSRLAAIPPRPGVVGDRQPIEYGYLLPLGDFGHVACELGVVQATIRSTPSAKNFSAMLAARVATSFCAF